MKKSTCVIFTLLFSVTAAYSQKSSNGRIYYPTESSFIYDLEFTLTGDSIVIADFNDVIFFTTFGAELLFTINDLHKDKILSIDLLHEKSLLATGSIDSSIKIWDYRNHKLLKTLRFQNAVVTSVEFSPDGKYILSGGSNNMVFLYNIETDSIVKIFSDHSGYVSAVTFSNDGTLFATCGSDKTIKIYSTNTLKIITSLSMHKNWVRDIAFSDDGTRLISCGDDSYTIVWNLTNINSINIINKYKFDTDWALAIDFFRDNYTYVTAGVNGKIHVITQFGNYKEKTSAPVIKILFKPNENMYLKLAVATRGKGAFFLDTKYIKKMRYSFY